MLHIPPPKNIHISFKTKKKRKLASQKNALLIPQQVKMVVE